MPARISKARSRLGLFALAVGVLLGGYYFGQQVRLAQLPIELLDDRTLDTEQLPQSLQKTLNSQTWVLLTAGTRLQCQPLLRRMIEVRNRLANRQQWQQQWVLARLAPPAPNDPLWQAVEWAKVYEVAAVQSSILFAQAGMQVSPACQQLLVIKPDSQALAILRLDSTAAMAESLRSLFERY